MNPWLEDIEQFHTKFRLTYDGPPRILEGELASFRLRFLSEEHRELDNAWHEDNLHDSLDALVDYLYVLLGTVYLAGMFPVFERAWEEVHRKNMEKELAHAANPSKRGFDRFDVVKPLGWTPPDHSSLLP